MVIVIVLAILVLVVFSFVAYIFYKKINDLALNKDIDTSIDPNITTAQEFLPFVDIKDGVIDMGGYNYVGVIECSSINYFLRTENEQAMVNNSFTRYINSLTFRTVLFNQTRIIDNSDMLKRMKEELQEASKDNEVLASVAEAYYNEMANLTNRIGNNKMKKKYILVPFNDAIELNTLSDEEKRKYSIEELRTRMGMVMSSIEGVGILTKALSTKEIVELIYSSYHRDNYSGYQNIYNGEHLTKIVDSKFPMKEMTSDELIDLFLYEAQNKISNQVSSNYMTKDSKYGQVVEELNRLRVFLDQDREVL